MAKRYWNYPEEYYAFWEEELTISPEYLEGATAFVGEADHVPVAFYSLVKRAQELEFSGICIPPGLWLDHMFVHPDCIGQGIGTALFNHIVRIAGLESEPAVYLLADPNAEGFYTKMGCTKIKDCPSSVPGRTTPMMAYPLAVSPA